MSSQHADPPLTVRPPAAVKTQAQEALAARDLKMRAFITACLQALNADADGFLEALAPHWPADKPRGRPPRSVGHACDNCSGIDPDSCLFNPDRGT